MSASAKDNLKDFIIGLLNEAKMQKLLSNSTKCVDLPIDDQNISADITRHAADYGIAAVEDAVHSLYPNLEVNLVNVGYPTFLHLIDADMIGKLIIVKGVVNTMDNTIKPMFTEAKFKCKSCGYLQSVTQTDPFKLQLPLACEYVKINPTTGKGRKCGGIKFDIDLMASQYIDSRKISIQSVPEDNTIQIPEMKDVLILKKSLLYKVRCGDRVTIIGVVKVRPDKGDRIANFYIEANNILVHRKDITSENLPEEDKATFRAFTKEKGFYSKLITNIAPSIFGMDNEKEACALALVSGVPRELSDINWREIIHVLFVGDPSTAKTQLLTATSRIAPSGSIFSSGRGSTAAGLTAAVLKEPNSNSWIISAGVLVLADRNVACIDEIDKMNPDDRSAMHDALERNMVSINKANIHVDLPAKTTVIAAANPILGQYDKSKSVVENVKNLPIPLLTRFDLIFIVKDIPDKSRDTSIFRHLRAIDKTNSLDREFMRKFLIYAKSLKPTLTDDANDYLETYYVESRAKNISSKIPITPRHADALIRLAEAHSKLFLKDKVDIDDAKAAIRLLGASMEEIGDIQTQPESKSDRTTVLIRILEHDGPTEEDEFKKKAQIKGVSPEEFTKLLIELQNCGKVIKMSSSPATYGLPCHRSQIDSY